MEQQGKQTGVYALDPSRGRGNQLATIEWTRFRWGISPEGSRLAVLDEDKHKGRIDVLARSDRTWHEVSLGPGAGILADVNWAADGKGFFVTSAAPDSFNLLYVTLAGKVKTLLHNGRRQYMANPFPSPDGKYLAFQAQTWDSNMWLLEGF